MLTKLYRKHILKETRQKIYDLFLGDILYLYRKGKSSAVKEIYRKYIYRIRYSINKPQTELDQAKWEWSQKRISPYPNLWEKEYNKEDYIIYTDEEKGLNYVVHKNKKLYFSQSITNWENALYRSLLIEQDNRSAHQYTDSYANLKGKNLLDVGQQKEFLLSIQ